MNYEEYVFNCALNNVKPTVCGYYSYRDKQKRKNYNLYKNISIKRKYIRTLYYDPKLNMIMSNQNL